MQCRKPDVLANDLISARSVTWRTDRSPIRNDLAGTFSPERADITGKPLADTTISIAHAGLVLSSMLATGLGLTVSEITTPLRNARLVLLSRLANFVVMPIAALAPPRRCGSTSARRGPLLLGRRPAHRSAEIGEISKGNLAFGWVLMVLLMVVTVGYLPLVLRSCCRGVSVNPAQIARSSVSAHVAAAAGALVGGSGSRLPPRLSTKPVLDRGLHPVDRLIVVITGNEHQRARRVGTRGPRRSPLPCRGIWGRRGRLVDHVRTRGGSWPSALRNATCRRARGGRSEFHPPEWSS